MMSFDKNVSRRTFIKGSLATISCLAIPQTQGCASFPKMNIPGIEDGKPMVLTHANIVDVLDGKIMAETTIVINGGSIEKITDTVPSGENICVIDVGGKYIIPGLIDGHCHTTLPGIGGFSLMNATAISNQMERNYWQHIVSGTTTVRDASAFKNFLHHYTQKIKEGKLAGPRIIHPGTWMNIEGSHPGDFEETDISRLAPFVLLISGNLYSGFKDTVELRKALNENLETHPSFIKLTLDDESLLCGKEGKNPVYSDEHIGEFIKFSEAHDLPIAAHVQFKYGFDRAQDIPIQHLEHIVCDAPLSDKDILKMARNNITIVPTLTLGGTYATPEWFDDMPEAFQTDFVKNEIMIWKDFFYSDTSRYCLPAIKDAQLRFKGYYSQYACAEMYKKKKFLPNPFLFYGMLTHGVKSLKKMKEAGILIGCGTDAGVPFVCHGTLWREMEFYSRIGFKNDEILRCATINNARILGMEDKIGSIEENKLADLVVLSDNPLENITAARDPELVIKEGEILFAKQPVNGMSNRLSI